MVAISDFVKIQKNDSCKHLATGMRYPNFVQWSGFVIPEFANIGLLHAGCDEDLALRRELGNYARVRMASSFDVLTLFCASLSESISENVKEVNGTIDVDFLAQCKNATEFLDIVKTLTEKYTDKITFHPFLGIHSDKENNLPLATMLLDSGLFEGIELYGSTYAENPEKFLEIFKMARNMNMKSRICCLGFRTLPDRDSIFEIMLNLKPTHLMNPNIAINNDGLRIFKNGTLYPEVCDFIKDHNVHIEFSPAPILSGKKGEQKAQIIRAFAENDISFSLCTEDMLFLNKSISEFATDLCNTGVFSVEEMSQLISDTPSAT